MSLEAKKSNQDKAVINLDSQCLRIRGTLTRSIEDISFLFQRLDEINCEKKKTAFY
jgi:hypothetical protein